MTLFDDILSVAFGAVADVTGQAISYARGSTEVEITAIVGSQTTIAPTEYENFVRKEYREQFIIDPTDLLATFGEPVAGDKITYTPPGRSDVVLTFTVRPDDGEKCFRPTERFHTRWRVNCVLTGKESA
jgi:hypothetical protein